jgi:hypothetical protein
MRDVMVKDEIHNQYYFVVGPAHTVNPLWSGPLRGFRRERVLIYDHTRSTVNPLWSGPMRGFFELSGLSATSTRDVMIKRRRYLSKIVLWSDPLIP